MESKTSAKKVQGNLRQAMMAPLMSGRPCCQLQMRIADEEARSHGHFPQRSQGTKLHPGMRMNVALNSIGGELESETASE